MDDSVDTGRRAVTATDQATLSQSARLATGSVSTGRLVAAFYSGRNERTLRAYRQDLEDFRRFAGTQSVGEVAHQLLACGHGEANALALAYKADLVGRELAAATVNRRLAALRSLVKLARTLGMVPWTLEVENVAAESYRDTRGPGRDGFNLLLDKLDGRKDAKAVRDRALIRLLFDSGLRRGEVVSLDVEHVDLEARTVSVLGKARAGRPKSSQSNPCSPNVCISPCGATGANRAVTRGLPAPKLAMRMRRGIGPLSRYRAPLAV